MTAGPVDTDGRASTLTTGARGGAFTLGGQALSMVIQFVAIIVLARLLSPSDFGLIAMITVFVGIGELLRDFGMPAAALQARTLDRQQASNVFWVSAALSLTTMLALAAATPLIVGLYDEPRLELVVPAMAGIVLVNGLQAQFQVQLARSMRFAVIASIGVAGRLTGLLAAVAAALAGWGYWALVLQIAVAGVVSLGSTWWASGWIPHAPRRDGKSLPLMKAGLDNAGANILGYAADNTDTLVIGVVWGPTLLGYYTRAFQLFMASVMSFFTPLTNVVVPTVNKALAEGRDGGAILARAQSVLCGMAIWALLVSASTADVVIPALLGEEWRPSIVLLQILALGGAFRALSQTNYWAYLVNQQSRQLLLSNLVTKPIQVVLIVVAVFHSVEAVAWAYVVGRAIAWPVNLVWLWRTAGQDPTRLAVNGVSLVVAGLSAFACSVGAISWLGPGASPILELVTGVVVSTVVYGAIVVLLPGGRRELRGGLELLRALRP